MLHADVLVRVFVRLSFRIQAQVPGHQTRASDPRFGIDDAVPPLRCLHELRVLFLEDLIILLCLPVPGAVGRKHQVHFLEGALVGFGVEGPDNEDGEDVDGAEDVEGFFVELVEHCWEEEDLLMGVLSGI